MVALHIRNVDDAIVAELKRRAARNHRSLEGELRALLEQAAFPEDRSRRARRRLRLHTVTVGGRSAHGRDELYGDEER